MRDQRESPSQGQVFSAPTPKLIRPQAVSVLSDGMPSKVSCSSFPLLLMFNQPVTKFDAALPHITV